MQSKVASPKNIAMIASVQKIAVHVAIPCAVRDAWIVVKNAPKRYAMTAWMNRLAFARIVNLARRHLQT